jgi:hypothetical protein
VGATAAGADHLFVEQEPLPGAVADVDANVVGPIGVVDEDVSVKAWAMASSRQRLNVWNSTAVIATSPGCQAAQLGSLAGD